jgi:hypothetical protein
MNMYVMKWSMKAQNTITSRKGRKVLDIILRLQEPVICHYKKQFSNLINQAVPSV